MRRLLGGIVLLGFLSAYPMGGKAVPTADMEAAGELFLCVNYSKFVTASNVVQVDTLSVGDITLNATKAALGQTDILVTMSVFNTAEQEMILDRAALRFFTAPFSAQDPLTNETLTTFLNAAYSGLNRRIPARATADITFNITAADDPSAFARAMLTVDGYAAFGQKTDAHWRRPELLAGVYQYAARVTANLDTSGLPEVTSVEVAPNPAKAGPVIVTVNFSEPMDMLSTEPLVTLSILAEGVNNDIISGAWSDDYTWVGQYTVLPNWNGTASITVIDAWNYDRSEKLIPAYDAGEFIIDTISPSLNIYPASQTANIGLNLPVQLVADEPLSVTPQIQLEIDNAIITSSLIVQNQIDGITWNGFVNIPLSAMPLIGEIATFNLLVPYEDAAGNTSDILEGIVTVHLAEALPIIATVNFDTVAAYDGIAISAEPFISVFVLDYKNIAPSALNASSARITVDGVLAYSGPASIYKIRPAAPTAWTTYQFDWQYPLVLEQGDHSIEIGISDVNGLAAEPYKVRVKVNSRNTGLVRPPVPVPNPFSPNNNEETQIVYHLTKATDVNIYIYDINGNVVWRRYIPRGQEGAHAGLNKVSWDGRSSFNNTQNLPNGIYLLHLLVEQAGEKKSLGRTKILILN